jgi:sugar lactone lactonase YvrE
LFFFPILTDVVLKEINQNLLSFRTFFLNFLGQLLSSPCINISTTWKQNTVTVAGGNDSGTKLNQLSHPFGIYVDDDYQCIYIADCYNHRIVKWEYGADNGQVVAGGNGKGHRKDQLHEPTDVIVDKKNDSLIIYDYGNRRVVRWSLRNATNGQTIISNIIGYGLAMDNNGDLYVSDYEKHEVRRYKIGDKNGTLVAGGNGKGNDLNQLNQPSNIFVDQDHSIYVSDSYNHRVMKWMKGAKEGIVVAGGQGNGNSSTELSYPRGVIVDDSRNVYVADYWNDRIMRWSSVSEEGSIVAGENREGNHSNQFNGPTGLSFDRQGNLYVIDFNNHRVQKFDIL